SATRPLARGGPSSFHILWTTTPAQNPAAIRGIALLSIPSKTAKWSSEYSAATSNQPTVAFLTALLSKRTAGKHRYAAHSALTDHETQFHGAGSGEVQACVNVKLRTRLQRLSVLAGSTGAKPNGSSSTMHTGTKSSAVTCTG